MQAAEKHAAAAVKQDAEKAKTLKQVEEGVDQATKASRYFADPLSNLTVRHKDNLEEAECRQPAGTVSEADAL